MRDDGTQSIKRSTHTMAKLKEINFANLTLLAESIHESLDEGSKGENVLLNVPLVQLLRQAVPQVEGDVGDLVVRVAAAGLKRLQGYPKLMIMSF